MLLLALSFPVRAQVFIMEEDEGPDRNVLGNGALSNVIVHSSPNDQTNFVPIGGGLLLLTSMGGLYFLKKKKQSK